MKETEEKASPSNAKSVEIPVRTPMTLKPKESVSETAKAKLFRTK